MRVVEREGLGNDERSKECYQGTSSTIVIYEPSARRRFSNMSAQATKERVLHLRECVETSSHIEVCTIFFETNISIFKLLPNSSQFSE
jgi:hypothetical protein